MSEEAIMPDEWRNRELLAILEPYLSELNPGGFAPFGPTPP